MRFGCLAVTCPEISPPHMQRSCTRWVFSLRSRTSSLLQGTLSLFTCAIVTVVALFTAQTMLWDNWKHVLSPHTMQVTNPPPSLLLFYHPTQEHWLGPGSSDTVVSLKIKENPPCSGEIWQIPLLLLGFPLLLSKAGIWNKLHMLMCYCPRVRPHKHPQHLSLLHSIT